MGQRGDRACGTAGPWAGSLVAVAGVAGLVWTIRYFAGDLGRARLGGIQPGIFLFACACFLVLGLAFGVTAWLTRIPSGR